MNSAFWGRTKPPPGTPIDWGHPLSRNLRIALPLWEGAGGATFDAAHRVRGTLNNAPPWGGIGDASGNNGRGLKTNGAYVAFGADTRFNFSGDQTIFVRLYYDGTGSGNRRILTSPQTDSGSIENYALYITTSAILTLSVAASSGATRTVPDTTGLAAGWHSVAGRIPAAQAGGIQLFRDSQQFTNSLTAVRFQGSAPVFYLSRFNSNNEQNWPGYIECVWIWERLLSDTEIALLTGSPYCFFAPPPHRRYFVPASVVVNTLTLSATQAQVAVAVRQAGAIRSATQAQVASVIRQAGKPLAPAQAQSASIIRQAVKPLAPSQGQSATLSTPATRPQTLTPSQGQAASIVRQGGKPLSPTQAQAASVIRQGGKPLAGSQAQVASVVRQDLKPLTPSQGQAASVTRSGEMPLSATQAEVASVVRQAGKPLPASQGQTASVTRQAGKPLSASQAQVASIIRQAGKALAALQDQVATVTRTFIPRDGVVTAIALSAVATATASVAKTVLKALSAAQSQTATVAKGATETVSALQGTEAVLSRSLSKSLAVLQAQSASLVRSAGRVLAASVAAAAAITAQFIRGGHTFFRRTVGKKRAGTREASDD